jgi:hypothetical protein
VAVPAGTRLAALTNRCDTDVILASGTSLNAGIDASTTPGILSGLVGGRSRQCRLLASCRGRRL